MKFLLLSCSTGEGHNSAARAMLEAFERCGDEAVLADPVSFQSERSSRTVARIYNRMIQKTPRVFGAVYGIGAAYSATGVTSPIYFANAHYAAALADYLESEGFDAVLSTHLYGMEAMRAVRERLGKPVPSYGILTDYTVIPFLQETHADRFFVPHEAQRRELTRKGVPAERVTATGIPVSERFRRHPPKEEARAQLGLPEQGRLLLVMTGGAGCENVLSLCDTMERIRGNFHACVIAGGNRELLERMLRRCPRGGHVLPVGRTGRIDLYMAAADVMISKAGGLSSTEAAVANVPLVHFRSIPGCETKNRDFFQKYGMSLGARSDRQALEYALLLAADPDRAEAMRACQRKMINPMAADDIARTVADEVAK